MQLTSEDSQWTVAGNSWPAEPKGLRRRSAAPPVAATGISTGGRWRVRWLVTVLIRLELLIRFIYINTFSFFSLIYRINSEID
ncbi:mini zinc finger protein 1 [Phtheirospermum japonicum]|uniref:Mini zinc finger protein 1 n=1 Tax=Phtheirospermum japonicum TaxID=374723 RepID=A0A830CF55_9LAMI|nr:mini zinc finger protein 1 [Phtheirospermum japonicum]